MANPSKRLPGNAPGNFFVDDTCIDCDTCRQLAPAVFGADQDQAVVRRQPVSEADRRSALHALVSCPTGSIGGGAPVGAAVIDDFPLPIDGPVHICGFNSRKSYGGNSWFIRRPEGNWLVDSPRFLPRLARRFEQLGGIRRMFLTHRDDVADADQYAARFGAERIIHRDELAAQPGAECVLDGTEPIDIAPGFLAIPTPGHTRGHCVLLLEDRYLFTGDHLAWDRAGGCLTAFRDYCWHSWERQTESMARLARRRFEWVLPGHGQSIRLPADEMRRQMDRLVSSMRAAP